MSVEIPEPPAVAAGNPFPGLRPFEEHEADRFFGREGDISELLSRLRHMRFLAVVGASGCGKSSLIRAGLIASLKGGALPGEWRVAVLRPWQSPVAQLAAALSGGDALNVPADSGEEAAAMVKAILQKGALGIVEACQRYPLAEDERLLILVDQFEELFTFVRDVGTTAARDEARAFVNLLIEVLSPKYEQLPVYVALTMRSDFLGECALYPGLADAINNGLYLLPRMERDYLRDAIKGPVEMGGGAISERLTDTLINDLRDDTDHLPILQHAMMRLWDQWVRDGGERIDFAHYKQMGELSTTLCKHAEEVFNELDLKRGQPIAEAIFRSITRVKEGKVVRRQTKLGIIRKSPRLKGVSFEEVERVLNAFRAEGRSFLVPPLKQKPEDEMQKLDDEVAIDISHESLIRQWDRLNDWALKEATSRELHKRISALTRLWLEKNRDPDYLIWGANLFEASDWVKKNPDALSVPEGEFILACLDAYEKEQLELKPRKEAAEKLAAGGATQVASIKKGSAKVFLAYARKERPFAERLREAFREVGEDTLVDWDILPAGEFEEHISAAIGAADTFVFVISPASVQSSFCLQELRYAALQNKRIVPVVVRKVDEWKLPEQLKKEHWIRFDDGADFAVAFDRLREAIKSDLVWVQAHTRLLVRATDWEKRDRDANLLLRGHDLAEAKQWLGKPRLEPALTALQGEYIIASDEDATRRQKERTAFITGSLVVSVFLLLVAGSFGIYAYYQAGEAKEQRIIAEQKSAEAQASYKKAEENASIAVAKEKYAQEQADEAMKQASLAKEERQQAEQERQRALVAVKQAQAARLAVLRRTERVKQVGVLFAKILALDDLDENRAENERKAGRMVNELAAIYYEEKDYRTSVVFYKILVEDNTAASIALEDPQVIAGYWESYARVLSKLGRQKDAAMAKEEAKKIRDKQPKSPKQ
jgi:energy-coupling factor transporter ATP-binding protein EcfA2